MWFIKSIVKGLNTKKDNEYQKSNLYRKKQNRINGN